MTQLTGQPVSSTYGDVITCTNNGQGLSLALSIIQDGFGNNSPLMLAQNAFNINRGQGQFLIDSSPVLATSPNINSVCQANPILPGTGGFRLPIGNTAQRAGAAGSMRFNSQTGNFEGTTDGVTWRVFTIV